MQGFALVAESNGCLEQERIGPLWTTNPAKTEYNLRPIALGHEYGRIEQGTRRHGLPR